MNKAQVSTDTPIILSIIVFQTFIIIMLGFLNINIATKNVTGELNLPLLPHISFTQNIITNITLLGWGNLLIFLPLEICLGYIILKLIRGGG